MRDSQKIAFIATSQARLLGKQGNERVYYSQEVSATDERLFTAQLYKKIT